MNFQKFAIKKKFNIEIKQKVLPENHAAANLTDIFHSKLLPLRFFEKKIYFRDQMPIDRRISFIPNSFFSFRPMNYKRYLDLNENIVT